MLGRRLAVVAVAAVAAGVMSSPAAFGALPTPVLGWKYAFKYGNGFGTVRPSLVYLGGDATGEVKSIKWHGWGDGQLVGFGRGWCPGKSVATGHPCAAKLQISDIGGCNGRRAYRRLQFFFRFRPHRPWRAEARYNICNGDYLGSG